MENWCAGREIERSFWAGEIQRDFSIWFYCMSRSLVTRGNSVMGAVGGFWKVGGSEGISCA